MNSMNLSYIDNPPVMTEELGGSHEHDRKELLGEFCRGCRILYAVSGGD